MSKRSLILLVAAVAVWCLGASAALAQDQAGTAAPNVTAPSTSQLPSDPYLGGAIVTKVPMARFCRDYGQCEFEPNGTPCDTPQGCVCGYSGFRRKCGRF